MISVCMTSYNGEKYIEQQIRSILEQIGQDDEVIISDDGSTDATLDIIEKINDPRISLIKGPGTGSLIQNFEHVLNQAHGDVIFTTDQDDVWKHDKVSTCLFYLKQADCIVSDCQVVDSQLQTIHPSFFEVNHTLTGKFYNLLIHNGYLGCCMAFKKELLPYVLPFPKDIPQHDIWIGNVAAFKFKLLFIDDKLIKYRRHQQNASTTSEKNQSTLRQKMKYLWTTILGVLKVIFK